MMTPSNQVESNGEESSSSGGSFVHSMNLLSTDSTSSGDSPSDMSGQHSSKHDEASEVSEESDPENAKDAAVETNPKSEAKGLSNEGAPTAPAASARTTVSQQDKISLSTEDLVASSIASNAPDQKTVEALALIAVEAASRHAPLEQLASDAVDSSRGQLQTTAQQTPQAAASDSIYSGQLSGAASSDQSVERTVGSYVNKDSSRSDPAALVVSNAAFETGVPAAVEPKAPLGHIHLKAKKSSQAASVSKYRSAHAPHPTPIASMPSMPTTNASKSTKSKSSSSLRRGKWTVEEEAYVARVIQDFNSGFLNAPAGTTLRSYLSEKLHCDPMRITKKFTGDACIGKRVFHPAVRCATNAAAIDKAQAELEALERRWRRRLEMQQRESAKKAAASAAAAVAAATGRSQMHGHIPPAPTGVSNPHPQGIAPHPGSHQVDQAAVARTATWLDRANAILSAKNDASQAIPIRTSVPSAHSQAADVESLPPQEIENQMKEVQRLIHEGPIIQQTTAGIPHLLERGISGQRKVTEDDAMQGSSYVSSPAEPADKRARTSSASEDSSGAEDAEALVGFLNSVRASAEASGNSFAAP